MDGLEESILFKFQHQRKAECTYIYTHSIHNQVYTWPQRMIKGSVSLSSSWACFATYNSLLTFEKAILPWITLLWKCAFQTQKYIATNAIRSLCYKVTNRFLFQISIHLESKNWITTQFLLLILDCIPISLKGSP